MAARGPSDTRVYPWGDAARSCLLVNSFVGGDFCVGDTATVGSYPAGASPYGVMDMSGNVWEWVSDWYDSDYYSSSPASDPTGPGTGTARTARGSSWNYDGTLRVALRRWYYPNTASYDRGFRCVRSP